MPEREKKKRNFEAKEKKTENFGKNLGNWKCWEFCGKKLIKENLNRQSVMHIL